MNRKMELSDRLAGKFWREFLPREFAIFSPKLLKGISNAPGNRVIGRSVLLPAIGTIGKVWRRLRNWQSLPCESLRRRQGGELDIQVEHPARAIDFWSMEMPAAAAPTSSLFARPTASSVGVPIEKAISVRPSVARATGQDLQRALHSQRADCTKNCRILIIDDEEFNVRVVRKHLMDAGYKNCVSTTDSREALDLINHEKPDLVLLDIVMPDVSGVDILHAVALKGQSQQTPIVVLTATADREIKQVCLELGAVDFLAKPVDLTELLPRVRSVLLNKIYQDQLSKNAERLEELVEQRTREVAASREEVVHCLARAAEYRDDDTGRHVVRVGKYVGVIAKQLGFAAEEIELIELAAQLHDIGKIGVPDAILHKPGTLDADQYEIVKQHCTIGRSIIKPLTHEEGLVLRTHSPLGASLLNVPSSPLLMLAGRIAQTHHERWDGTGYPLGLKGEDIPIEGRMTAVADVFDALATKRPYKAPFSREKCFTILEEGRGTHFDPKVLDAFFAQAEKIIAVQLDYMDPPRHC